ncbi:MAG: protein kinase domain-containing protein [Aridibacter sp.]
MKKCPRCSIVLSDDKQKCDACGWSVEDEFASTIQKPEPDEDHTPTEIQENKTHNQIHTTTSDVVKLVAGTVLAERYRIIGLLGKGGMGEVYKAEDLKLDQTVALKFLPDKLAKNEDALKRFVGEVRNARQVSHENVCRVFDIGEINEQHFISMEFVDGDDLSQLLRRIGRLPSDKAVEISRQICMGLNAIHKAGILHRDLKPANIIIDSKGKARITDFGIAGIEQDLIGKKEIVGTPAYMSPEQITGKEVTKRSDIYSLGLLLYEIFTGKQTFEADSLNELIKIHQSETPTNPSKFVENIDPLVEKVINRCLEKNPEDRPKSALQVALSLPGGNPLEAAIAAGETPSPEMVAAAPKKGALKPMFALACLLTIIAMFTFIAVLHQYYKTYNITPLDKSPEILAERAETIVRNLDYTDAPTDRNSKFSADNNFLTYASENKSITNTSERLRAGQPFVIYFLYRQSTGYLVPKTIFYITENDPPLTVSGMTNVYLDTRGRLVEFVHVPNQVIGKTTETNTADWTKLFDEAGLDFNKFEQTEPQWTPPVFADTQAAWTGTLADFADIPIRIEAAAYQGKPVYFKVVTPWDKPVREDQATDNIYDRIGQIIGIILIIIVLVGSVFIARHNLKVGRGDIKGAGKLAAFYFLTVSFADLITADHASTLAGETTILYTLVSSRIYFAAITALLYLALEPFARRWWSELLVSWNRLLAGDFRDPLIGRDILVGGFFGLLFSLILYFKVFLEGKVFGAAGNITNNFFISGLNGWSDVFAALLRGPAYNIQLGLSYLFVLVLFYIIFRNKKISVAIFSLIFLITVIPGILQSEHWITAVVNLIPFVIVIWVLFRFGLLTLIVSTYFYVTSYVFPLTFNTASHLFPGTVIVFAVILALTIYGFYISTAGQSVFRGGLLDDGKE